MVTRQEGEYLNIAGYRFVTIEKPEGLREQLRWFCESNDIRGTILLAEEGINFSLSAMQPEVDAFIAVLDADPRLAGIPLKISHSGTHSFHRMLVKVKRQIIPMKGEIRPDVFTGQFLDALSFKQWLDEGREVAILDTRNNYETKLGTFSGAIDLHLEHFRDFPAAMDGLDPALKSTPLVMYCTGGIRCEKASVAMLNAGFENVYQLEGGILNYLEQTDGSHWEGECFVFDRRVAVDVNLVPTETAECFVCREPVTVADQDSPDYVIGEQCPFCVD